MAFSLADSTADQLVLPRQKPPFPSSNTFSETATYTAARSEEIQQDLSRIRVNTVNWWGHAETWGTDNLTYPSKNIEDEATLGKCTDVRGDRANRKSVPGDLKRGSGLQRIGMSDSL